MPLQAVAGAQLSCSFGVSPSVLSVLPVNRVVAGGAPAANIGDSKPLINIAPFGMCSSLANPTVAAATAAALGILTPMPCIPATPAPWTSMAPRTLVGPMPALVQGAQLMCAFGGVIQILNPGQFTVQCS
ncbi:DUF4280 domain-containing protein [Nocardioides sp.]|uniref:DUF4280 domain-containing protein n=1 Tax=Nocardioides sp. TaxID=35761 RepID=UPI00351743BF